jgi:hypothetical protein
MTTASVSIPGGLGVLLPGSAVQPGVAMIAVHVPGSDAEPQLRVANADDTGIDPDRQIWI